MQLITENMQWNIETEMKEKQTCAKLCLAFKGKYILNCRFLLPYYPMSNS
jgi:hypothetical protein